MTKVTGNDVCTSGTIKCRLQSLCIVISKNDNEMIHMINVQVNADYANESDLRLDLRLAVTCKLISIYTNIIYHVTVSNLMPICIQNIDVRIFCVFKRNRRQLNVLSWII